MLTHTVSLGRLQKDTPLSQCIARRQPCLVNTSLGWILAFSLHLWPSSLEKGTNQAASPVCDRPWGGPGQDTAAPLTVASLVQWLSGGQTEASVYQQAEDGKTELSLMHFAITNPGWQPPRESTAFLGFLKEQVQRDGAAAGLAQGGLLPENALFTSIQSLQSESEVCSWGLGDDSRQSGLQVLGVEDWAWGGRAYLSGRFPSACSVCALES